MAELRLPSFRALRHPSYRTYFSAQGASMIGVWVQDVAMAWFVFEQTGSGTYVGLLLATEYLAMFLCGFFAGDIVDRLPKRQTVVVTRFALVGLAATLALTMEMDVGVIPIFVFGAFRGAVQSVNFPASVALLSEIVPEDDIPSAITLSGLLFNVGRLLGALSGSVLLSFTTSSACSWVNAVLTTYAAVAIAGIPSSHSSDVRRSKERSGFITGISYIWRNRRLRACLITIGVVSTFSYNVQVYFVLLARDLYDDGANTFAILLAIFSAGFVAAVLTSTASPAPKDQEITKYTLILGMAILVQALLAPFWIAGAISIFAWGAANCLFATRLHTIVQLNSAEHMKGRVMAVWNMTALGLLPLGAMFVGFIGEQYDPRVALVVASCACGIAGMYSRSLLRDSD